MKIFQWLIIFCISFVILFLMLFLSFQKQPDKKISKVCINDSCFNVELAQNYAERTKGLMYREYLSENNGMLFVFQKEGQYSFWMKNTLIPLDIIWIDANNKIVFINEDTQPCKQVLCPNITPANKSLYVLEINAGLVEKNGFIIGDKVVLKP